MLQKEFVARYTNLRKAGYPLAWVETHEPGRFLRTIAQTKGRVLRWDVLNGLLDATTGKPAGEASDPVSAVRAATGSPEGTAVALLNFHKFVGAIDVIQAIQDSVEALKSKGSILIIVAPVLDVPVELSRLVTLLPFSLPDAEEIRGTLDYVSKSSGIKVGADGDGVVDAALGLTEFEAENVLALSVVEQKKFAREPIFDKKAEACAKAGTLSVHKGDEKFAGLGGLDAIKKFCLGAVRDAKAKKVKARGVMVLGVPGTGKSAFAKALGSEVGRPTICLDFGQMFGSLVGESEKKMREALATVDAMAPAILFCDEIEKGLAGTGSSGQTDGGTTSRVFGTFLTWLNDHVSDVFVVATCNDMTKLPPEFSRAERWDAVFFVDLPGAEQREAIWKIHGATFDVATVKGRPEDEGWTGAEIRSACRLAALLGVTVAEAAEYVVPVAVSAREQIEALRRWAEGRCVDATRGGRYCGDVAPKLAAAASAKAGRKIEQ